MGWAVLHREYLDKIAEIREWLDESNLTAELEVDGGINPETAPKVFEAGARVLVAGSQSLTPSTVSQKG